MRFLVYLLSACMLASCGSSTNVETAEAEQDSITGWFGEVFDFENAIAAADIAAQMNDSSSNEFIVEGVIEECCQKKGCWMKVATANGETMRVSFKDYGFFVPLDAGGKTMVMKGVAMYDTIDVEFLKHLAEDANATQEEIDAITEPELAITFEATGVMIR